MKSMKSLSNQQKKRIVILTCFLIFLFSLTYIGAIQGQRKQQLDNIKTQSAAGDTLCYSAWNKNLNGGEKFQIKIKVTTHTTTTAIGDITYCYSDKEPEDQGSCNLATSYLLPLDTKDQWYDNAVDYQTYCPTDPECTWSDDYYYFFDGSKIVEHTGDPYSSDYFRKYARQTDGVITKVQGTGQYNTLSLELISECEYCETGGLNDLMTPLGVTLMTAGGSAILGTVSAIGVIKVNKKKSPSGKTKAFKKTPPERQTKPVKSYFDPVDPNGKVTGHRDPMKNPFDNSMENPFERPLDKGYPKQRFRNEAKAKIARMEEKYIPESKEFSLIDSLSGLYNKATDLYDKAIKDYEAVQHQDEKSEALKTAFSVLKDQFGAIMEDNFGFDSAKGAVDKVKNYLLDNFDPRRRLNLKNVFEELSNPF